MNTRHSLSCDVPVRAHSGELLLVHSDEYANWAFSPSHPTQGRRFMHAREHLLASAPSAGVTVTEAASHWLASIDELRFVHSRAYVQRVLAGHCDEWKGARPELGALATQMAGGTLRALGALTSGDALTAVHYAGAKHHAQYDRSSGFCVFADFAMAARIATAQGLRVAVLDIDAHHGDGTENLTRDDANVLTFSIHDRTIFPGTGHVDEPEVGVFNQPLASGAGDVELHEGVTRFLALCSDFAPDLVFIAAGADGLAGDPLSTLQYTIAGMTDAMRRVRQAMPATPMLMGGAGGYQPDGETPVAWAAMALALSAPRATNGT